MNKLLVALKELREKVGTAYIIKVAHPAYANVPIEDEQLEATYGDLLHYDNVRFLVKRERDKTLVSFYVSIELLLDGRAVEYLRRLILEQA